MKHYLKIKQVFYIVIVLLFTLSVWLVSSLVTEKNIEWARSLNKPYWQPPGWVFYVVWIVLFILISVSAIIILNERAKHKKKGNLAISLFVLNAFLTALYSIFYFGLKNILLAFIELPFLLAAILLLIWCTYKISKAAAYLLIPYLLWVAFATVLTGITLFIN